MKKHQRRRSRGSGIFALASRTALCIAAAKSGAAAQAVAHRRHLFAGVAAWLVMAARRGSLAWRSSARIQQCMLALALVIVGSSGSEKYGENGGGICARQINSRHRAWRRRLALALKLEISRIYHARRRRQRRQQRRQLAAAKNGSLIGAKLGTRHEAASWRRRHQRIRLAASCQAAAHAAHGPSRAKAGLYHRPSA